MRSSCRLLLLLMAACSLGACRREHATADVCGAIMDRIVELELAEQGFRDLALAEQKKRAMRALLDRELRSCVGRKLPPKALSCIEKARSTEEISHVCLH